MTRRLIVVKPLLTTLPAHFWDSVYWVTEHYKIFFYEWASNPQPSRLQSNKACVIAPRRPKQNIVFLLSAIVLYKLCERKPSYFIHFIASIVRLKLALYFSSDFLNFLKINQLTFVLFIFEKLLAYPAFSIY